MKEDIIIQLSKDYDNAEQINSNYFRLKLGGHKLKIWDICKHTNERTNRTSLKVCFDLADGDENDGCFEKDYNDKAKKFTEVFWAFEGTNYLSLDPRYEIFIKRFNTAVKKSNPDVEIEDKAGELFNFSQLIGLYVGGEYGLEEFMKDGEITTRLSLLNFKAIDDLPYLKEPRVKLLDGTYQSYSDYSKEHQFNEDEDSYTNLDAEEHYNVIYAGRKEPQEDIDLGFGEDNYNFN